MSILTNITDARISDRRTEISGKTTTRPVLWGGDEALNEIYVVNVDIGEEETLRDVAVAQGNNELRYAEVGSPVTLQKVAGHWTVVGFSKTMPGSYKRVGVTVPSFDFGLPTYTTDPPVTVSFEVRALTYGELGEYGTYGDGFTPYGGLGRFQDEEIVEIFT